MDPVQHSAVNMFFFSQEHWKLTLEFKVATVLEEQVLLGPTGNMWELTLAGQHLYGRHGTQTQATVSLSVCSNFDCVVL